MTTRRIMMERRIRMTLFLVGALTVGCLAGYWNKTSSGGNVSADRGASGRGNASVGENEAGSASALELSGSIRLAGSTSMEKLSDALAESFMEKYPNVNVTVEFVGSGAGIEAVLSGSADIGNSSRSLKDEEKAKGAVENLVAMDGIAICVDPANGVRGLTKQQLADIYTGAVTNWSEVGGEEFPIVVVGHEAGSGTREAFEELLGVRDVCVYANELGSSGAVLAKIAVTPGAVGYVSLNAANPSVNVLALESVEPTAENIKSGDYFLSRPFMMVTKGEIDEQSELIQAWFDHVLGEEGRAAAERVGVVMKE